jgi:hypothetical protein
MTTTLNESSLLIAESALAAADQLGIRSAMVAGTRVVDCGVHAAGSDAAGLMLAEVAMAGRGRVWLEPAATPHASQLPGPPARGRLSPWPVIHRWPPASPRNMPDGRSNRAASSP